jgi:uncharacterized protein (TIGR02757 family)
LQKKFLFVFNAMVIDSKLKAYLDNLVERFNSSDFIENDPISIPHKFCKRQDIEIAGFWTAILSWGQRITIINKANELFKLMDESPSDFIKNHSEKERVPFLKFKHRTFQPTDTLYFLEFLQWFYRQYDSLEEAFIQNHDLNNPDISEALTGFHHLFFSLPFVPERTRKHVPVPATNSACKKLNLFLRWMVRKDSHGVDFGLWNRIKPAQLLIPLDVHVERIARQLGLLTTKQAGWKAVLELTGNLRKLDPLDPVKYDFALFGLGVLEKHKMPKL